MELSAAQRRIAFVLVVFALAGLGVYLFTSAGRGADQPGASQHDASQHGASQPGTASASQAPQQSTPADSPSAGQPSDTTSATPPTDIIAAPDIYQWLPFSKAGLGSAATVAVRFGVAYGTFSYTESASAYVATMRSLVTSQLGQQISAAYSTPGVASLRSSRKQVSAGTADIISLRAFGANSLTFTLAVTEHVTATKDGGPNTTNYAVTVTGGGTNWQVSDVELASEGNS